MIRLLSYILVAIFGGFIVLDITLCQIRDVLQKILSKLDGDADLESSIARGVVEGLEEVKAKAARNEEAGWMAR
jgi:hypothetical protein